MQFQRTIGIDCSGAGTADTSLKGLRVYQTEAAMLPWKSTRHRTETLLDTPGLSTWLIDRLAEPIPAIVGIDYAFSFPELILAEMPCPATWMSFSTTSIITGRRMRPAATSTS